jgi:acetyltransferase
VKLDTLLKPDSIALIGASRDPEKVGHKIFKNIVDSGYGGSLHPVNPKADEVLGHRAYPSVLEIPGEIDLAVICIPAKAVPSVARECGRKGVKSLVVISAGFSEVGRGGTDLERELVEICREYGMRMQGPNCLGIIDVQSKMNASFASTRPPIGNVAFVSQSGALGSTILNWALQKDVGFTTFVSLGNEADLTAADFIDALAEDDHTRVIALYVEGVKDGKRFLDVASRVTRKKPIIALKAGTTDVGMRAVSSHTGSLAGSDTAFTAAFRRAGIIRVETLEELFNLILAFEGQPLPKSRNVLIVTNGGGPGILAADACEKMDLDLPLLERHLIEDLRKRLPPQASVHNPLDVLGDADENRYRLAMEAGMQSRSVDSMVVVLTPQAMTPVDDIAQAVVEVSDSYDSKPVMAVFMGIDEDSPGLCSIRSRDIPNYLYPEQAALVLNSMCEYTSMLERPQQEREEIEGLDRGSAADILREARDDGRVNLTIVESIRLARAYGIPVPRAAIAKSAQEAGELAEKIGYPVVMKIVSPEIIHKTDLGGVMLDVGSREDVERNYERMTKRIRVAMPDAKIEGMLVQRMYPSGREVIVGAVRDPQFGPLLMFGLGGIYVNFLRDVSYGLSPLTRIQAREMVNATKAYTLLRGVRGEPSSDIDAIVDVMVRLSRLMTDFDEVMEMEINPLFAYEQDCLAVDVRVTISEEKDKEE